MVKTIDDLDKKVLTAIHRIEDLYFESEGKCYVSFSGGKDSTVILALIKMSVESMVLPQDGIKAIFVNTGIELRATVDFVKWCKSGWYPNIEIIRPEKPFAWVIKNKGKPMKSKIKSRYIALWHKGKRNDSIMRLFIDGKTRKGKIATGTKIGDKDMHMIHPNFNIRTSADCCTHMKKKPFKAYNKNHDIKGVITGIRTDEGGARKLATEKRMLANGKLCTYVKGEVTYKYPIIDWTDDDIELFVERYNVPLSRAYTVYKLDRTGCMGCPFNRQIGNTLTILHQFEPQSYKASMFFLKDVYIAQNVKLPFDEEYEKERIIKWRNDYEPMRQEMLRKYRPNSRLIKVGEQTNMFDYLEEGNE